MGPRWELEKRTVVGESRGDVSDRVPAPIMCFDGGEKGVELQSQDGGELAIWWTRVMAGSKLSRSGLGSVRIREDPVIDTDAAGIRRLFRDR